jgi:hypothetical protein
MNDDYGDPSPPEDDPAITEEDPFVAPEAVVVGEIVDPFLGSRPLELTLEEIMARDERYEALRAIALRRLRRIPNSMIRYGSGANQAPCFSLTGAGVGIVASVFGLEYEIKQIEGDRTVQQEGDKEKEVYWARAIVKVTIRGLGGSCSDEGRCDSSLKTYMESEWTGKEKSYHLAAITPNLIGRIRAHAITNALVRCIHRMTGLGMVEAAEYEGMAGPPLQKPDSRDAAPARTPAPPKEAPTGETAETIQGYRDSILTMLTDRDCTEDEAEAIACKMASFWTGDKGERSPRSLEHLATWQKPIERFGSLTHAVEKLLLDNEGITGGLALLRAAGDVKEAEYASKKR